MWALKIAGIILLALFLLLALVISVKIFTEPTSKPLNLTISNLSDSEATLSWFTDKPVKGTVLISDHPAFPLSSFFSKNLRRDVRDSAFTWHNYQTHHLTITGLSAGKKYYYRIYQGVFYIHQGYFTTPQKLTPGKNRVIVSGRVLLSANGNTGAPGAIVYYQLISPPVNRNEATASAGLKSSKSALLSTVTNSQGEYFFDLTNLRNYNLKTLFNPLDGTTQLIKVVSPEKQTTSIQVLNITRRLNDIILK